MRRSANGTRQHRLCSCLMPAVSDSVHTMTPRPHLRATFPSSPYLEASLPISFLRSCMRIRHNLLTCANGPTAYHARSVVTAQVPNTTASPLP